MQRKKPVRRRSKGIFVYCTDEEKERIDRARKQHHATLSGYVLEATLRQVERDEQERRGKPRA